MTILVGLAFPYIRVLLIGIQQSDKVLAMIIPAPATQLVTFWRKPLPDLKEVPEDWHSPLRQRMVLLKDAGPVAEQFYAYVRQRAARAIFRKYGFILPGGAM